MNTETSIVAFWEYFIAHEQEIRGLHSAEDPRYDALLAALQRVDPGLYVQLSNSETTSELIITTEGRRDLFALVHKIIDQAPSHNTWSFKALKPAIGFPSVVRWEGFVLEVSRCSFDPLDGPNGEFGIAVMIPDLQNKHSEHARLAVCQVLDSALGEEQFSTEIARIQIAPLTDSPETYIPLDQLPAYLKWRASRSQG